MSKIKTNKWEVEDIVSKLKNKINQLAYNPKYELDYSDNTGMNEANQVNNKINSIIDSFSNNFQKDAELLNSMAEKFEDTDRELSRK